MELSPSKSAESSLTPVASPVVTTTPVASNSKSSLLRFPVRIGITWQKGERLEAQDFSNTWYPSKIVEISEEEKAVLIHFEGWNQRYDEWVLMASDRLRPTTRHSERKDKGINKRRRVHPHPIYRPGDEVFARWKDCKKYPAKISRLVEESTYEVVFYDGVSHLIQAMNIQPMTEEMKAVAKNIAPPSKTKFSFKQVKVKLPESIRKKQELKHERTKQTLAGKVLAKSKRSPSKLINKAKLLPKVTLKRDRELDVFSVVGNRGPPSPPKKENPVTITCEATLSTLSEAECLQLFGSAAVGSDAPESNNEEPSSSLEDLSIVAVETPPGLGAGGSMVSTLGTIHEGVPKLARERKGAKKNSGSRIRKRAYTDTSTGGVKKRKLSAGSTDFGSISNIKVSKKPQPPLLGSGERSRSLDTPGYLGTPPPIAPLAPQIFVPSKAFIVEEDHNPFKCPHEGCTKDFRKENLLQYHIKYYHAELEANSTTSSPVAVSSQPNSTSPVVTSAVQPTVASTVALTAVTAGIAGKPKADTVNSAAVQTASVSTLTPFTPSICTPKRRRRKTDSICSTDSELSASSKSKSSKRNRNDSEISVTTESPEVAGRETQTDSSRLVQELAAEDESLIWPGTEEAEEEEMASDVVNCVCGERHHTGLMIQCEVCMCWQHFKCADVKKTGVPPVNYVCLICEKAPGTRDSCKYLHDMGWERRGELPTFPFTQPKSSSSDPPSRSSTAHLTTLASECNDLLATLHGVKQALHSTRRQIKISKEEDDPEFQLWQTDWDNWIKPQEVLTLTPRSGDPELSPTPSTFLFPPATSDNYQGDDKGQTSEESRSSKPGSSGFIGAFNQAMKGEDLDLSLHTPTTSQTSSSSISTLQLSSTVEGAVSTTSPGPTSKPPVHGFPSQLFSISSTPPKISSATPTTNTAPTGMATLQPYDNLSAPSDRTQEQPFKFLATSNEAAARSATNFPLAINTAQALSVNTACAPAPSPSSSSLSSLQLSTPPMMLSPATGTEEAPPHTPSVGRTSSHLLSIINRADVSGLVKDLFPGPGGDAPARDIDKSPEFPLVSKSETSDLQSITEGSELTEECQSHTIKDPPEKNIEATGSNILSNQNLDDNSKTLTGAQSECAKDESSVTQRHLSLSAVSNSEDGQTNFHPLDKTSTPLEQVRDTNQDGEPDDLQRHGPGSPPSPSSRYSPRNNFWDTGIKQSNGSVSPDHASSLYLGANGSAEGGTAFSIEDDEDTQDNDTDTAEESADPYKNCEHNMLIHVQKVHADMEEQLESLEARILELENSEHNNPSIQLSEENILNDIPALKKSLSKLARHLVKVQHFVS